jgi:hypothetical protein
VVTFTAVTYSLTFQESGLPAGTNWSITVNSMTLHATTSAITFAEPNATDLYTVGRVPDYQATPANGTVRVNGSGVTETISFAPPAPPPSPPSSGAKSTVLGLPPSEGYAVVAGIVVLGAAVGVTMGWLLGRRRVEATPSEKPPSLPEPPEKV